MSQPWIGAIERLAARFAVPPWDAQMVRARREWDEKRGRVYDDDEVFSAVNKGVGLLGGAGIPASLVRR